MRLIQDWGDPVRDRRFWRGRLVDLRGELDKLNDGDPKRAEILAMIAATEIALSNLPPDVVNS